MKQHPGGHTLATPRPPQLRRLAIGLVLVNMLIIGLLGLVLALSLQASRNAYGERAKAASENLAITLSLTVQGQIKQVDNALQSTAQQLSRLQEAGLLTPTIAAGVADEQRTLVSQVGMIRLTDASGQVLNGDADSQPVSVQDRDYFISARSRPGQLVVSEPLQGRYSRKWGLVVARARTDSQGRFLGIVYANMYSQHFRDIFDDVAVGAQGAVTLRTNSLRLVARYSPLDKTPEVGLGTATVSDQLRANLAVSPDKGTFLTRTALDGVERLNAYQRVPGYPLLLLAGQGVDEFYRPWQREMLQQVALTLLLTVLVISLSAVLYRRHAAETQARQQASSLAAEREALLHTSLVGMSRVKDRISQWFNPAFAQIFGYELHELVGHRSRMFYPDEESYQRVGEGYRQFKGEGQYRVQIQMLRKDGRLIWVDLSGAPLPNGESLWMFLDITAVKESEQQALRQAQHDGLTGLVNRSFLMESLVLLLRTAERNSQMVAVCYLDLDGFKAVNDVHGHEAGDALLKEAGLRMRHCVRANDVVGRLGGDEFAIVLVGVTGSAELELVLARLVRSLSQPFTVGDGVQATVGASVGVALYPHHGAQADALLAQADGAMYLAKRAGKNRFVVSGRDVPAPSEAPPA